MSDELPVLARLMDTIEQRKAQPTPRSYTATLLSGGGPVIGAKILEEAAEVVQAAEGEDDSARTHLICEAADLIYHLLVLLGYRNINISEVEAELAGRFGTSGLDEKAAREG